MNIMDMDNEELEIMHMAKNTSPTGPISAIPPTVSALTAPPENPATSETLVSLATPAPLVTSATFAAPALLATSEMKYDAQRSGGLINARGYEWNE